MHKLFNETELNFRLSFNAEEQAFKLENLLNKSSLLVGDFYVLKALRRIFSFRDRAQLLSYLSSECGFSFEDTEDVVASLEDFFSLSGCKGHFTESFKNYNWEDAGAYLSSIYDYPFLAYEDPDCRGYDAQLMKEYYEESPPPDVYKLVGSDYGFARNEGNEGVEEHKEVSFDRAILDARSYKANAISVESASMGSLLALMRSTFGQTGWIKFPNQGRYVKKLVPSGGSRHPTEAYVVDYESLKLLHFDVKEDTLKFISNLESFESIRDSIFEMSGALEFSPKYIIILTSMVDRSMWRYREPRTYRVLCNDVGHIVEHLSIGARALSMTLCTMHGFSSKTLSDMMGLSEQDEIVMRAIAIA